MLGFYFQNTKTVKSISQVKKVILVLIRTKVSIFQKIGKNMAIYPFICAKKICSRATVSKILQKNQTKPNKKKSLKIHKYLSIFTSLGYVLPAVSQISTIVLPPRFYRDAKISLKLESFKIIQLFSQHVPSFRPTLS